MAAGRLEFRILGPLAVRVDGARSRRGPEAARAARTAPAEREPCRLAQGLIGELFAGRASTRPTTRCATTSRGSGRCSAPAAATSRVSSRAAPGYLFASSPASSTSSASSGSSRTGRRRSRPAMPAAAAGPARGGSLWYGRPLADLEFERLAQVEAERLEELRLAAVEERIDAELALGRQLALVPELEALVAEHPYRERFRAQLMLALYRCGRQAEGLEVYRADEDAAGRRARARARRRAPAARTGDPRAGPGAEHLRRGRRARAVTASGASARSRASRRSRPRRGVLLRPRAARRRARGRLADTPLLAIVGPSGSGKSSLLRAGLLPALEHECACSSARASGRCRRPASALSQRRTPRGAARARGRPVRGAVRTVGRAKTSGVRSWTRSSTRRGTRSAARSSWSRCAPTSSAISRPTSSSPISSGRTTSCSGR